MPIDYSKWDALELSDDSDIEVHPNVDKKSFIRAKQSQIHQQRAHRKGRIITLQYERIINDGLLVRIDRFLTALKSNRTDPNSSTDDVVLQALVDTAASMPDDEPPAPPEGIHKGVEQPLYSQMMASLVDQVKTEIESKPGSKLEAYIAGVEGHKSKVEGLNVALENELLELEKEEKRHITSDNLREGFSVSHVSKKQTEESKTQERTPELLNGSSVKDNNPALSSGAEADVEDTDRIPEASPAAIHFAKIAVGDYRTSLQYLSDNPNVVSEKNSDGLLAEAFNAQMDGKESMAKQCVHQALLLSYCLKLGRDGVALFFKRITTKDHQAKKLFTDDVQNTYQRIKIRTAELNRQKAEEPEGVEQIQLQAVDPGTTIHISVPPPIPADLSVESSQPPPSEDQIAARSIFESFPPNLQKALELGSLEEINRVLGKMSVDEAEEVVAKLSEGGMLSLEQGVIDATTEEGQKVVEEIQRTKQYPGQPDEDAEEVVMSQDPPF